jgi:hypothetical protein
MDGEFVPKLLKIDKRKRPPKDAVLIDRSTKWGNPYVIGRHGTRDDVIRKHMDLCRRSPRLLDALPELLGYNLICHCEPGLPCHGYNYLVLLHERHGQALPSPIAGFQNDD